MERFGCARRFDRDSVIAKPWDELTDDELDGIAQSGYVAADYVKTLTSHDDGGYRSLYFLNSGLRRDSLMSAVNALMSDPGFGRVFRLKGFLREGEGWLEINATRESTELRSIDRGQDILIVIGENLNESKIRELLKT